MSTALEERPKVADPGDSDDDKHSHIIHTPDRKAEAVILEAMVSGTEIEALCGYRWIPSRDPLRLPVCPKCLAIAKERGLIP